MQTQNTFEYKNVFLQKSFNFNERKTIFNKQVVAPLSDVCIDSRKDLQSCDISLYTTAPFTACICVHKVGPLSLLKYSDIDFECNLYHSLNERLYVKFQY